MGEVAFGAFSYDGECEGYGVVSANGYPVELFTWFTVVEDDVAVVRVDGEDEFE